MDPPSLVVNQSEQFVVKFNFLCDLTGAEVRDLVSDGSYNVVSHCKGENTGETSQVIYLSILPSEEGTMSASNVPATNILIRSAREGRLSDLSHGT